MSKNSLVPDVLPPFVAENLWLKEHNHPVKITDIDSLRDYCSSQLPDIPYSSLTIVNEAQYGENETITVYYCHVESALGDHIFTSPSLSGMFLIYYVCKSEQYTHPNRMEIF